MQDKISKGFVSLILEFFYTVAHWLGEKIVWLLGAVFPSVSESLVEVADPIGVLAILTIILLVAQVARKLAWIIVSVAWILIVVRVLLIVIA
ncbi:MAG: hypothetical protein HY707_03945 [Ignavibacteriae bacterium]|nr:hypothetical protein [Ignavibacteriota bacterium]